MEDKEELRGERKRGIRKAGKMNGKTVREIKGCDRKKNGGKERK